MSKILSPTPVLTRLYRMARLCIHLLEGVATTAFLFPLLKPRTQRILVRLWSRRLLRMLNIDMRLQGALVMSGGNVLLVANHVSWLDIFVLNAIHPARFIAKAELARWPLVGRLVRNVGTLFVERARKSDTHRINRNAADALANGDVVAVFPEGKTSDGTDVLPFKSSLLQSVVEANGHVQPVALRYCATTGELSLLPAYFGNVTMLRSLWQITSARSLVVEVHAASRLAASATHRRDLARAAEAAIRAALLGQAAAMEPGTPGGPETVSP
jgi:1-acyl-sn-glycerol-3-phosphate acyltransferase